MGMGCHSHYDSRGQREREDTPIQLYGVPMEKLSYLSSEKND